MSGISLLIVSIIHHPQTVSSALCTFLHVQTASSAVAAVARAASGSSFGSSLSLSEAHSDRRSQRRELPREVDIEGAGPAFW